MSIAKRLINRHKTMDVLEFRSEASFHSDVIYSLPGTDGVHWYRFSDNSEMIETALRLGEIPNFVRFSEIYDMLVDDKEPAVTELKDKSVEYCMGYYAQKKHGKKMIDNPFHGGMTDDSVERYKDWLDGYLLARGYKLD